MESFVFRCTTKYSNTCDQIKASECEYVFTFHPFRNCERSYSKLASSLITSQINQPWFLECSLDQLQQNSFPPPLPDVAAVTIIYSRVAG